MNSDRFQNVLTENLMDFERRFLVENINTSNFTSDIVMNFNDAIEKSFLSSGVRKKRSQRSKEKLNSLQGKDLWEKIDWSGKLSSTRDHNIPEADDLYRHFKALYAPVNEPVIELPISDVYIPVTDDPISEREILKAFTDQKRGIIIQAAC